jgi:hypothetical protein
VKTVGQVEISCGDYWDFPRVFITRWHGKVMMFYCPFDDDLDDYGDHFAVYELPSALAEHIDDRRWNIGLKPTLESEGKLVGRISVNEVKFPFKDERRWSGGEPPKPGTKARLICWMDDEIFKKLGLD